jgi:methyltransferase (TIGR00027 family)
MSERERAQPEEPTQREQAGGPGQEWDIVSGVGLTALAGAAARAIESSRPDRLIEDPFAAAFVEAAQPPVPMPTRMPDPAGPLSDWDAAAVHASGYMGLRARFFDDYLAGACSEGVRQAVVLAAGLDTRAFRLDWPAGVRLFELDQPKVLEFKDAVLGESGARPRCARTPVPTDLRGDWLDQLLGAGFDPGVPTVWLAEGLLPYLPPEAQQQLFSHIHQLSAAGSHLAVERLVRVDDFADNSQLQALAARFGIDLASLLYTDERPDPADWLAEQGWSVNTESASVTAERYQRALTDPRMSAHLDPELRVSDYTAFLSARRTR